MRRTCLAAAETIIRPRHLHCDGEPLAAWKERSSEELQSRPWQHMPPPTTPAVMVLPARTMSWPASNPDGVSIARLERLCLSARTVGVGSGAEECERSVDVDLVGVDVVGQGVCERESNREGRSHK